MANCSPSSSPTILVVVLPMSIPMIICLSSQNEGSARVYRGDSVAQPAMESLVALGQGAMAGIIARIAVGVQPGAQPFEVEREI